MVLYSLNLTHLNFSVELQWLLPQVGSFFGSFYCLKKMECVSRSFACPLKKHSWKLLKVFSTRKTKITSDIWTNSCVCEIIILGFNLYLVCFSCDQYCVHILYCVFYSWIKWCLVQLLDKLIYKSLSYDIEFVLIVVNLTNSLGFWSIYLCTKYLLTEKSSMMFSWASEMVNSGTGRVGCKQRECFVFDPNHEVMIIPCQCFSVRVMPSQA